MKIPVSSRSQRAYYNFAESATDGAAGTIQLNPVLPVNAIIKRVVIDVLQNGEGTPGGETPTNVSFGLASTDGSDISLPTGLALNSNISAFVAGDAFEGQDFNAAPLKLVHESQVTMTITGSPVTGGEWAITVEYSENTL